MQNHGVLPKKTRKIQINIFQNYKILVLKEVRF